MIKKSVTTVAACAFYGFVFAGAFCAAFYRDVFCAVKDIARKGN